VDDLLELARGDSAAHEPRPFAVDEAVDEALELCAGLARERRVTLRRIEDAHGIVQGDRVGVIRAIANLIGNAIRYGPVEGEVSVSSRKVEQWCEIDVADRGPGVPEEERRRIFERFVRLATARREHPDGSGLGLAIVDQVARAHGGRVEVLDREGGGALFRLRLPAPD
jgi:two-component system sensor histidine kinase SenX3